MCRHKKPHKGDVVDQKTPYTLHADRKYVWVWWCVMCLNPKCTTLMGHQLHYKSNIVPDSKPRSIRTMSVSQLQGGRGVVPCMRSNFIWSSIGHIYIYTPIYCVNNFESWSLDEANPTVQRWQIRALLAVGYHLHSTRFCHMYNLEDSMVELKHNAQTSKHKHFSFVLESSVS